MKLAIDASDSERVRERALGAPRGVLGIHDVHENRGKSVGESVVSGGAFRDAARVTRVPEGPPIPFDLDGIGVTVIAHGAAFHRTRGALPVPRASRPSP